jgi:hypothetical protein
MKPGGPMVSIFNNCTASEISSNSNGQIVFGASAVYDIHASFRYVNTDPGYVTFVSIIPQSTSLYGTGKCSARSGC